MHVIYIYIQLPLHTIARDAHVVVPALEFLVCWSPWSLVSGMRRVNYYVKHLIQDLLR